MNISLEIWLVLLIYSIQLKFGLSENVLKNFDEKCPKEADAIVYKSFKHNLTAAYSPSHLYEGNDFNIIFDFIVTSSEPEQKTRTSICRFKDFDSEINENGNPPQFCAWNQSLLLNYNWELELSMQFYQDIVLDSKIRVLTKVITKPFKNVQLMQTDYLTFWRIAVCTSKQNMPDWYKVGQENIVYGALIRLDKISNEKWNLSEQCRPPADFCDSPELRNKSGDGFVYDQVQTVLFLSIHDDENEENIFREIQIEIASSLKNDNYFQFALPVVIAFVFIVGIACYFYGPKKCKKHNEVTVMDH